MDTKRGAARWRVGFWVVALLFAWLAGTPATAVASPGCQVLNGQSGTLGANGFIEFLNNSQPVNQGDAVTLTSSGGPVEYVGSFLQMSDSSGTVAGTESGSGASADGLENLSAGSITYSVACTSAASIVSSVSPSPSAPGSTVTISGSGFYGTSAVNFGGTPATSFTVSSGNTITATVPNGSGTVAISVTTDAGTATGGSFTFAAPTAGAVSATVAFDSSGTAIASNVTGNPTSVAVASAPSHGVAVASGTSITYKPTVGYAGPDSFTYTASNSAGTSSPATVSITVGAPTLALSPSSLPSAVAESSYSQALSASGGTAPYTYVVASGTLPSGLSLNAATGSLSGVPLNAGSFNFTVRATDSSSGPAAPFSATQTYTFTVNAPVITVMPASLPSAQQGTAYSQALNASGGTGPYAFSASGNLPAGLVLNSTGVLSGTPTVNGSFNFTVVATDGDGFTGSLAYAFVVGVPNTPTVSAKSASTAYDTPTSIDLSTSISGVDITAVAVATQPAHGTVSVSGETVTYTPSSTFYGGTDGFTYTATNPGGTSAPVTVTIVIGTPAAPTVASRSASTAYNTAASINLASAISGVDITAVTVASQPAHGTMSVSGETVTYTPSSTFYGGTDSFTYTATNPGGTSSPATVTVTVTPLSVPSAQAISVSTTTDTPVLIEATTGATGPEPPTGVSVATAPAHGSASASGGQITYTPAAGFVGSDSFGYRVANHFGSSALATITVTVTATGRLGAATGTRTVTTTPGTALTVNLDQIVPDTYVSSALTGLSPGNAGHATLSQPARLTFAPNPAFRGLVQVSAVLVAASGHQVTIDVLVLVSSQPDPSKNPDVLGLANAQTEQAQRFAQSQLDNIDGRLESLHDGSGTALFSNTLSISLDGQALQAPRQGNVGKRGQVDRDESPFGNIARPGMGAAGGELSGAAQAESSVGTLMQPSTIMGSGPAGLGLWIAGAANFGSFEAYRRASGFDSDSVAVNVGVDQRIDPHALIGFSLGYNHDNADIANNGTRSIAKGYSAALYGSYQPSAQTYVDMVLGGGGLSFGSRRYDADSGSLLSGQRNGSQWFGSLTAGYQYHSQGGLLLSPYLRLEQSLSELNGFSEGGVATAALSYGSQTLRTSLAVLGLRASEQLRLDRGMLVPRARLEIGHDFQGTSNTTLSYAFIPSAGSWNVLTNPYAANGTSVQLGLGLDLQLPRNLRLTTDYEYLTQPHSHDQMIRFGLNKQF